MPQSMHITKRPALFFVAGMVAGIGMAAFVALRHFSSKEQTDRPVWVVEQVALEPDVSVDRVNFGEDRESYNYRLFVEVRSFGTKDIPALAAAPADANELGTQRQMAFRCFGGDGIRESAWNAGHRVYRNDHHLHVYALSSHAYFMLQIAPSWRRWRPDRTRNLGPYQDAGVISVSTPMAGHSIIELTSRFGDYLDRTVPPYNELSWDAGEIQLWTVYSHDTNTNTWYATRVWIESEKKHDH